MLVFSKKKLLEECMEKRNQQFEISKLHENLNQGISKFK